jgi:hypothetical protein
VARIGTQPSAAQWIGGQPTRACCIAQVRAGANLFHIHAGRVTQLVVYFERDRALADLGLVPDAGS